MSSAREEILARLERARPPSVESPQPMIPPAAPNDLVETLRSRVEDAGGHLQSISRQNDFSQLRWPVDLAETNEVFSSVAGIPSRGHGLKADVDHRLDGLALCVIQAEFAVAENGAVWHVPTTPRERAAALLATHLVLVVPAEQIVPTMHEAYERIDLGESHFGWFLCGPSKTADIEQALVLGAHGPKTMTLVLLET